MKYNTILEGFTFQTTPALTFSYSNVTSTDRGQIIATDIVTFSPLATFSDLNLTYTVGGRNVFSNMEYDVFRNTSYPGFYPLIPLKINDGQTFEVLVNNFSAGIRPVGIVFIREGYKNTYQRNSKLSTWRMAFARNLYAGANTFSSVIPKNRGNCIGFRIWSQATPITDGREIVTLRVNGETLVQNVPLSAFDVDSTRPYKEIYIDIPTGSTFDFVTETFAGTDIYAGVEFIFES